MSFLNIFSKKKKKEQVKVKIIIDFREKNSLIPSELIKLGFEIEFKQLPIGDYLVNNVAIERKTISDLKSSIINKRIFSQLKELEQYPNKFLIIEGFESEDIYDSTIHENAFRGFILSIITENKVPIIFSLNEKDTAKYLAVLAKKKTSSESSIRASKIFLSEKEQLQFVLEGFPNIGPVTAKKLLEHFKSIKSLVNASEEELKEVIGKKAQVLHKLLSTTYT